MACAGHVANATRTSATTLASAAVVQPIACKVVVRVACTPVVTAADGAGPARRSSSETRPETTGM